MLLTKVSSLPYDVIILPLQQQQLFGLAVIVYVVSPPLCTYNSYEIGPPCTSNFGKSRSLAVLSFNQTFKDNILHIPTPWSISWSCPFSMKLFHCISLICVLHIHENVPINFPFHFLNDGCSDHFDSFLQSSKMSLNSFHFWCNWVDNHS